MDIALAALRTLLGLGVASTGAWMLVHSDWVVGDFGRWGLPPNLALAIALSALAVVCGLLFAAGALTRPVGLLLATMMAGLTLTAGRVDGGALLAVPPLIFLLAVFYAWRAGRFTRYDSRRPGVQ